MTQSKHSCDASDVGPLIVLAAIDRDVRRYLEARRSPAPIAAFVVGACFSPRHRELLHIRSRLVLDRVVRDLHRRDVAGCAGGMARAAEQT